MKTFLLVLISILAVGCSGLDKLDRKLNPDDYKEPLNCKEAKEQLDRKYLEIDDDPLSHWKEEHKKQKQIRNPSYMTF